MGQRTLAAIVFTDVVNFSGLTQQHEERTLRFVQRDLAGIRAIASTHEGQVLKSTGDGLLIFFNSAVHAVSCSLEIQRWLAEERLRLPPGDSLQHRIGVHLGDVFVSQTDVMGDGVNIASRIQSEAEPGGICISQTVYDVVKNQLGLRTTYLGPRELKNIRQSVPVYRILLEAQGKAGTGRAKPRFVLAVIAGVLAAVAAIVAITLIARSRKGNDGTSALTQPPSAPQPPATTAAPPATAAVAAGDRAELVRRFDFRRLAQKAREAAAAGRPFPGADPVSSYDDLADLWKWSITEMAKHPAKNPLKVSAAPLGEELYEAWRPGYGDIAFRRNGTVTTVAVTNMSPSAMGLLLLNLIEQSEETPARKQELFAHFVKFAREYNLDPRLVQDRVLSRLPNRGQRPLRNPGMRPPGAGPQN